MPEWRKLWEKGESSQNRPKLKTLSYHLLTKELLMNDDTRIISKISDNLFKKVDKDIATYLKSLDKKESFRNCYNRALGRWKIDIEKPFKAKDFWNNLIDCGSWLEFRHYENKDITKLHTANFCKRDKLCPACAVRRAYKQQQKFMKILEADQSLKDEDWYYIVLPVRHNKDESYLTVYERLESVRKKITMSMRNSVKGRRGNNFWSQFTGGMFSVETTKTKNGWNIHLNLIVNAPKGSNIPLKSIKNRKGQVSHQNDDLKAFLMRTADSYMHDISKIDSSSTKEIRNSLVEVLKYSLKFSSLSNSDLLEVYVRTYRKRLFGTFGNMRGVGIEQVELEGDIAPDEKFIELIFRRVGYEYKLDSLLYKTELTKNKDDIETTDFNQVLKHINLY